MIIADRFVFLHLHKSGGTFVNEFLLNCVPGARRAGYHLPRMMIPPEQSNLPVLGMVRNPWSYYVSWYAFQSQLPHPNALFRILSQDGTLSFDLTIRNMLNLGAGSPLLGRLVAALPPAYTNQGLNLPGGVLTAIRDSGVGFYSFLYRYMYRGGGGALHVGRMEQARTELLSMLTSVGQPLSPEAHRDLLAREPSNVSTHSAYTTYYDGSLRDLVADRDGELIERHGYRFGEPTPEER
jgi:hypothetical protein